MSFCVKDLLRMDVLKDVKLLSGKAGLGNEISGVTIIEAPDIAKFVGGGEVLLTSLYAFKDCTAEEYKSYMEQLSQKNVSALVIKEGRVTPFSEDLMKLLTTLSEEFAIPLLQIPFEIPYRNIMYPIMESLFNSEVTKLKYFKTTHDNFVSLSLSLPAGSDGNEKVLQALEELIGNPVALFDKSLHCLATTNPSLNQLRLSPEINDYPLTLYSKYTYLKQTVTADEAGQACCNQYVVPVNVMFNRQLYLVITETDRPINELDYIAVENAITALLLEFSKLYTANEVERKFKSEMIGNILQGKIRARQKLRQMSQQLHLRENAAYRVAVLSLSEPGASRPPDYDRQVEMNNLLFDSIIRLWPGIHVHDQANSIAVLQETAQKDNPKRYLSQLRDTMFKIQEYIGDVAPGFFLTIGLGNFANGLTAVPESYRQANDALMLADIVGHDDAQKWSLVTYSDLGVIRLLFEFSDREKLRQYIPRSLLKLYDYKKPPKNDLINTLKVYLDNNQNVSKTAQDLYVHYKTVIYRVERIAEITGLDFDNPNEVLSVRVGLLITRILEGNRRGLD